MESKSAAPGLAELVARFRALADPARLRLLALLAEGGELTHTDLVRVTGFSASKVSRHLAALRQAGLVRERRAGVTVHTALAHRADALGSALTPLLHELAAGAPECAADRDRLQALRAAAAEGSPSVLFVCTHNAARSQLAEALLRQRAGGRLTVASAGLEATTVHPHVRQVLAEAGIATDGLRSKHVAEVLAQPPFTHVITLCLDAEAECPRIFPGVGRLLSWPFEDVAAWQGPAPEKLARFRALRDAIDQRLAAWLAEEGLAQSA